jgi:carboxylate-amine ligase
MTTVLPAYFIVENKWRAMRWGLDAELFDFVHHRRLSMRQSIHELLDFVDDVLDDLGSRDEMAYLRALLTDPRGTGADRQIALYQQTGSIDAVIRLLMQQTMQGLPLETLVQVPASNGKVSGRGRKGWKLSTNRPMPTLSSLPVSG